MIISIIFRIKRLFDSWTMSHLIGNINKLVRNQALVTISFDHQLFQKWHKFIWQFQKCGHISILKKRRKLNQLIIYKFIFILMSFLNLITQSNQNNAVKPDYIVNTTKPEDIDEDTIKYQRIRKVRIIESNQDEDNQATLNPYTQFKAIKSNENIQEIAEKCQIAETFKFVESNNKQSLRQKFGWLLPEHMKIKLGKQQIKIVESATKIDNYLSFQKTFRGSKCGDLFKNIKKNLYANYNLVLEFTIIKKILFLDSKWYECKKQGDDIRINLPYSKVQNDARKCELRQKIVKIIKNQQQIYKKNTSVQEQTEQGWAVGFDYAKIQIPQFQFEFEKLTKITQSNIPNPNSNKNNVTIIKKSIFHQNQIKLDPKSILLEKKVGEDSFKEKLYKMIALKEERLKKQKEEIKYVKQLCKADHIKIIEELNLLYIQKNVNNMFYVNLIEILSKRTNYSKKQIEDCINQTITRSNYMKIIDHLKGNIVQIKKQLYKQMIKIIEETYP